MKVIIGPYVRWISSHQVFGWLKSIIGEKATDIIEDFTDPFFQKLYAERNRTIKIKIDDYDIWNMDSTLALIISPMLKQLKENDYGAPIVDNEDVPSIKLKENATEDEKDVYTFAKWTWVLDEMIWVFSNLAEEDEEKYDFSKEYVKGWKVLGEYWYDEEGAVIREKRIVNALRLFGKYYRGLWE